MDGYPKRYIVLDPHQVSARSLDPRADALAPYPPSTQVSCVTLGGGGVKTQGPITNVSSLRSGIERSP